MPWELAIDVQRACSGRRKAGLNVFFCVVVGGFVLGFVLLWHKNIIHKSMPCFQEHDTRACSKLRNELMRQSCRAWFKVQFSISDAARG